jgi:hypothetical protein
MVVRPPFCTVLNVCPPVVIVELRERDNTSTTRTRISV